MCRAFAIDSRRRLLALLLALLGLYQLGAAALIQAKAALAPLLIEQAWQETLATGRRAVKPWPWADTWPVARLRVPARGVELLVLAGDSGNALAFGPGHASASAPLGGPGQAVIGGHRDTHFGFLRWLQAGDELQLELSDGASRHYRVTDTRVVDSRQQALRREDAAESLLLVTCYPFDSLSAGGPLRYLVRARPVKPAA